MPKVQKLGESLMRGNANNFYIRSDDDLDDQDTDADRGAQEYPHIHVRTTGPNRRDDIVYIGITWGVGGGGNLDIYDNNVYQGTFQQVVQAITAHCPGISAERVQPLTQYLFGYPQHGYNQ